MTTVDFITELFCRVDDVLREEPVHAQAHLHPSELVTVALLFALKGVGNRAFYRWLSRDYRPLFPRLPERPRLFRLFVTHQAWTDYFLADPIVLGIADTYGIELLHPRREGRSTQQIGRKGLSNHRWIVGGKLGVVLNQVGLVSGWSLSTANTHDSEHARQSFPPDGGAVRRRDDHLDRSRLPRQNWGPPEHEGLSTRRVERADAGRDDVVDVDHGLSFQENQPAEMALF